MVGPELLWIASPNGPWHRAREDQNPDAQHGEGVYAACGVMLDDVRWAPRGSAPPAGDEICEDCTPGN